MKKDVCIVGAGLVGTLLSIYLARKGFKVDVYETRFDIRKGNVIKESSRSINLTIGKRGTTALEDLGIKDRILQKTVQIDGRLLHNMDGTLSNYKYIGKDPHIYSISRSDFNIELLNIAVEEPNISVHFRHKCIDVNLEKTILNFKKLDSDEVIEIKPNITIGADGIYSRVRSYLRRQPFFNYKQEYVFLGYKEVGINPNKKGDYAFPKNTYNFWARGDFMLSASANLDNTFTGTLFLPYDEGKISYANIQNPDDVKNVFQKYFPDVIQYIDLEIFAHTFLENLPAHVLGIHCNPWSYKNKVLLIGDAAHGVPPFYGQGMNSGFEDCRILAKLIDQHGNDWSTTIKKYEQLRIKNTKVLAELTEHNFKEIRSGVNNPNYLLTKKIEILLNQKYPDYWIPCYTMVALSNMPYSEAYEYNKRQKYIMSKILQFDNIEKKLG